MRNEGGRRGEGRYQGKSRVQGGRQSEREGTEGKGREGKWVRAGRVDVEVQGAASGG